VPMLRLPRFEVAPPPGVAGHGGIARTGAARVARTGAVGAPGAEEGADGSTDWAGDAAAGAAVGD
jgi:hypothetical protein